MRDEITQAIRTHVQDAGPAGITRTDLLQWVRNSYPSEAVTNDWLSLLLYNGTEAGWYVQYEPGEFRDGHPVEAETYVAAEHGRPSAAEVAHFIGQAKRVGQRRDDLVEWLRDRYGDERIRLDQLEWWLGELTGARTIIPHDRQGMTYFVAAEHADTGPRELSRLRLPVGISEYTRWLNTLDQVHGDMNNEYGKTTSTTSHLRHRRVGDDTFAVFYDRPVDTPDGSPAE